MTAIHTTTLSPGDPKVSVIIPVYNVARYLQQCLDSVITQTLADIEIICVNDGSPDNSQFLLDRAKKYENRLVLLKHDSNKGLAAARNTGMRAAKGKYIFFLDADDFLASDDSLEILYRAARSDDADETIGGILKWNENTGESYLDWHANYLKKEVHGLPLEKLPELFANVVAVNKLLRRSLLEYNQIYFNENIRKHEDNPFSCRAHIVADKITIIPKTTYIYRQAENDSLMSREKKEDAYYRCAYCHDIFSFVEEVDKRHIYRKMYYPMYSRQLTGSAEILSHFQPSEEEKTDLLDRWNEIIKILPDDLPDIPQPQRDIFTHLKSGDNMKAWEKAVIRPISPKEPDDQNNQGQNHELARLKTEHHRLAQLKRQLKSQIETVYASKSWCMTEPIRRLLLRIRGY